jgi:(1->4)-alpha-D-glucan 1-alpha-D-glucosylmutase
LSEVPGEFAAAVKRWSAQNARHRQGDVIDPGTEWFLYQTMVGAWPIESERLCESMRKSMREAKVRTSWVDNNENFERALNDFIEALLADQVFLADFGAFVDTVLSAGRINSLAQTLLKYTSPGVPDMYQGGELWDLSLVDPDNRRPVDYKLRSSLLTALSSINATQVMQRMDEGLPKLWLVHHALHLRSEHPEWFGADAAYLPLTAQGQHSERVIAYVRGDDVLTVVPRWSYRGNEWGNTTLGLPSGVWRNRLTDETFQDAVSASALFASFPVALLVREGGGE